MDVVEYLLREAIGWSNFLPIFAPKHIDLQLLYNDFHPN